TRRRVPSPKTETKPVHMTYHEPTLRRNLHKTERPDLVKQNKAIPKMQNQDPEAEKK
ncbi:15265_t:CDS:2, partial [Gigaspora rosea]